MQKKLENKTVNVIILKTNGDIVDLFKYNRYIIDSNF